MPDVAEMSLADALRVAETWNVPKKEGGPMLAERALAVSVLAEAARRAPGPGVIVPALPSEDALANAYRRDSDHDLGHVTGEQRHTAAKALRLIRELMAPSRTLAVGDAAMDETELDTLPVGAVVRPQSGGAAERYNDGWCFTDGSRCLARVPFPARVLDLPATASKEG